MFLVGTGGVEGYTQGLGRRVGSEEDWLPTGRLVLACLRMGHRGGRVPEDSATLVRAGIVPISVLGRLRHRLVVATEARGGERPRGRRGLGRASGRGRCLRR